MSNCSDERLSMSSDKATSVSSPSDKAMSVSSPIDTSDKDEEFLHQEDDEGSCSRASSERARGVPMEDDEYFGPIKKLRMVAEARPEEVPQKPLTSFFIKDILSHKSSGTPRRHSTSGERSIVRPWDLGGPPSLGAPGASRRRPRSADDDSRSDKSESDSSGSPGGVTMNSSPLDALFEMTSKAFEGLDANEKASGLIDCCVDLQSIVRNHQELEKYFKLMRCFWYRTKEFVYDIIATKTTSSSCVSRNLKKCCF